MGVQMSWGIPKEWKTGLGQHCWRGSGALMEVGCIGSKGASEIYRAEESKDTAWRELGGCYYQER